MGELKKKIDELDETVKEIAAELEMQDKKIETLGKKFNVMMETVEAISKGMQAQGKLIDKMDR